ncbi:unnamed protein product [Musa textilis]
MATMHEGSATTVGGLPTCGCPCVGSPTGGHPCELAARGWLAHGPNAHRRLPALMGRLPQQAPPTLVGRSLRPAPLALAKGCPTRAATRVGRLTTYRRPQATRQ